MVFCTVCQNYFQLFLEALNVIFYVQSHWTACVFLQRSKLLPFFHRNWKKKIITKVCSLITSEYFCWAKDKTFEFHLDLNSILLSIILILFFNNGNNFNKLSIWQFSSWSSETQSISRNTVLLLRSPDIIFSSLHALSQSYQHCKLFHCLYFRFCSKSRFISRVYVFSLDLCAVR